jgi:hypothetical protein
MDETRAASIEFLRFLADIYEPGTGQVIPGKLAGWLGLSEEDLQRMMLKRSDHVSWPLFADELLEILDAVHDRTRNLSDTIHWFRYARLPAFDMKTSEELLVAGDIRSLLSSVRACNDVLRP